MNKHKMLVLLLFCLTASLSAQQDQMHYNYDDNGNRIQRNNNNDCDCDCPQVAFIRNRWLELTVTPGSPECGPGQCKLTHSLNIPPEFACYTYYAIDDGSPTPAKLPLPSSGPLAGIDRCINDGEVVEITVLLYRSVDDPSPCNVRRSVICGYCECPASNDTWFTLTATPGGENCPQSCEVTNSLTIPADFDCFTHYNVLTMEDNNPMTLTESGISSYDGELSMPGIDRCLAKNSTLFVQITLMRSAGDPTPCIIERTIGCDYTCCDYITVDFVPTDPDGNNCCWLPFVNSSDEALCDPGQLTIAYTDESGNPITLGSGGELCLGEDQHEITYTISIGGETCDSRTVTLSCGECTCPPDHVMSSWAFLDVDKYSSACSAGECAVAGFLDIPEEYASCYSHYTLAYKIKDKTGAIVTNVDHAASQSPIGPGGSLPLPTCIPAGETIQYEVRLYQNGSTTEYCEIVSNEAFCERIENVTRPEPCDVDNPNDAWSLPSKTAVEIDGCTYWVTYQYRKTADGHQDVQMTEIEKVDPNCNPGTTQEEIFQGALPRVINSALQQNPAWVPQTGDAVNCADIFRVVQNSCWATFHCLDGEGDSFTTMVPCNSDCCARQLRVCNIDGAITVEDLGFAQGSSTFNCSQQQTPGVQGPCQAANPSVSCEDASCDVFDDIDGGDIDIDQDLRDRYNEQSGTARGSVGAANEPSTPREVVLQYQVSNSDTHLDITIAETSLEDVTVTIHNILGQPVLTQSFDIAAAGNFLSINISNLASGTYICSVTANDHVQGTSKFQIVK